MKRASNNTEAAILSQSAGTNREKSSKIILIVTAIGVIASIVIPFAVEIYKDRRAELSISYTLNRPLVSREAARTDGLTLNFNHVAVSEPWLVVFRLENNSETPVDASDVREPLTITFQDARILRATVIDRRPSWLRADLIEGDSRVHLNFSLLNRSESVTVELLFDKEPKNLSQFIHFRGGEQLRIVSQTPQSGRVGQVISFIPTPLLQAFFFLSMFSFTGYTIHKFQEFLSFLRPKLITETISQSDTFDAILLSNGLHDVIRRLDVIYGLPRAISSAIRKLKITNESIITLSDSELLAAVGAAASTTNEEIGMTPEFISTNIKESMSKNFRSAIRSALKNLPRHTYNTYESAIDSIFVAQNDEELFQNAKELLKNLGYELSRGGQMTVMDRPKSLRISQALVSGFLALSGTIWLLLITASIISNF